MIKRPLTEDEKSEVIHLFWNTPDNSDLDIAYKVGVSHYYICRFLQQYLDAYFKPIYARINKRIEHESKSS